jgi:hypothetical protein
MAANRVDQGDSANGRTSGQHGRGQRRKAGPPVVALYFVMACLVVGPGLDVLRHPSIPVLVWMFAGGTAYSVGAIIHARCRFRFHNAVARARCCRRRDALCGHTGRLRQSVSMEQSP